MERPPHTGQAYQDIDGAPAFNDTAVFSPMEGDDASTSSSVSSRMVSETRRPGDVVLSLDDGNQRPLTQHGAADNDAPFHFAEVRKEGARGQPAYLRETTGIAQASAAPPPPPRASAAAAAAAASPAPATTGSSPAGPAPSPNAVVTPYIRNFVSDPQQLAQYEEVVKRRQQGGGRPDGQRGTSTGLEVAPLNNNNHNNMENTNVGSAGGTLGENVRVAQPLMMHDTAEDEEESDPGAAADYGPQVLGPSGYSGASPEDFDPSRFQVMGGRVGGTLPWHYGVCSCVGGEWEPTVEALACYYCQASRQCNMLLHNRPEVDPLICGLLVFLDCLTACSFLSRLFVAQLRRMVRERYGIRGNMCRDCCVGCCCCCCGLRQTMMEMAVMNDFPGACVYKPPLPPAPLVEVMQ